jgi:hypothetical protein
MSFDTLEEFNNRTRWPFIIENVLKNPNFASALTSPNKHSFFIK